VLVGRARVSGVGWDEMAVDELELKLEQQYFDDAFECRERRRERLPSAPEAHACKTCSPAQ